MTFELLSNGGGLVRFRHKTTWLVWGCLRNLFLDDGKLTKAEFIIIIFFFCHMGAAQRAVSTASTYCHLIVPFYEHISKWLPVEYAGCVRGFYPITARSKRHDCGVTITLLWICLLAPILRTFWTRCAQNTHLILFSSFTRPSTNDASRKQQLAPYV